MGIGVDIQEESFSKKSTSSYNLSALVGADRFSFFAYDQGQKRVGLLRSYASTQKEHKETSSLIHSVCTRDDILQLPFKKIRVAIADAVPTYIPDRLFKAESAADYLQKMVPSEDNQHLLIDHLRDLHLRNIYAVTQEIVDLLRGYLPSAEIHHPTSWLISGANRFSKHRSGYHLYLNVRSNNLQIALFEGDDFLFCNQFRYKSTNDFVYFTLLVFEQFNLKPASVPVYLSGEILEDSDVYRLLYRYIRHLHFVQLPDFLIFGKKVQQIPSHLYFNLFCEKLCG